MVEGRVADVIAMLQPASQTPLVLRQVPIRENDIVTGFVDLALERAFVYREHAESEVVQVPEALEARRKEARYSMLEQLADFDDALMEQLLEDVEPPRDRVFDDLRTELKEGLIVPVLMGSAENANGVLRLLKALRHEVTGIEQTAARLGTPAKGACAQVLKTFHTAHGGKLSLARILAGEERVFTCSMHCDKNYPVRKAQSDLDIALPDGMGGAAYLDTLRDALPVLFERSRPDVVFYNAGVDVHGEDRLGKLALTNDDIRARDETVIGFFRERGIAVCGVIGGGDSSDTDALAARHALLFETASWFA